MSHQSKAKQQRGDTLIEVLLAIGVLGVIVTISYTVMNRGFNQVHIALDRTNTQAIMAGQASMLRAAHALAINNEDRSFWDAIKTTYVSTTTTDYVDQTKTAGSYGKPNPDGCSSSYSNYRGKNFYFNANRTDAVSTLTPAAVSYDLVTPSLRRIGNVPKAGDGIWIEGHTYEPTSVNKKVYVFYIKACWTSQYAVGSTPSQDKTIVRLYDATN